MRNRWIAVKPMGMAGTSASAWPAMSTPSAYAFATQVGMHRRLTDGIVRPLGVSGGPSG